MISLEKTHLYQFAFFAPGSRLEPSPEIIADLLKAFSGTDFMPTTIQEMRLGPIAQTRQQLHLVTKKSDWRIEFEPHRIAFTKTYVPNCEIGTLQKFSQELDDYAARLSSVVSLNGTRLSYVTKGWLNEMEDEELEKVAEKLFTMSSFYQENTPVEWNYRTVARYETTIKDNVEIINVITDINRIQGLRQENAKDKEFSCIEIGFDINTFQNNRKGRFQLNDAGVFLQQAKTISQRLLTEIEEIIS